MIKLLIYGEVERDTTCYSVITDDAKIGFFSNCLGVVTMYITVRVGVFQFFVGVSIVVGVFQFVCFNVSKLVCFNYFTLVKYEYVDVSHTSGTSHIHY